MIVAIGADHGGFNHKEAIKKNFSNSIKFIDVGAKALDLNDDYPEFSFKVAELVKSGQADFGIMLCRTGAGAVIAMNKVLGIRAGVFETIKGAKLARSKNNANILSFGADNVTVEKSFKLVETFLTTEFSGGRHQRRLEVIADYEQKHIK